MKIYDHQDGSNTVRRLSNADVEHSNVRGEGTGRLLTGSPQSRELTVVSSSPSASDTRASILETARTFANILVNSNEAGSQSPDHKPDPDPSDDGSGECEGGSLEVLPSTAYALRETGLAALTPFDGGGASLDYPAARSGSVADSLDDQMFPVRGQTTA
jgi:hypothetical protein